jgi:hypothetical protein
MIKRHAALAGAALVSLVAAPAYGGGLSADLLLSSAWCTFKYSKISGYSNTTRVRFNPNGMYSTGGRAEGGASGRSGSIASQRDSTGGGRWKVERGEFYMSEGGPLEQVQTVLKRNNNGHPIIVADGVEYSQCP